MNAPSTNFEIPAKQIASPKPLAGKLIFIPSGLAFYPLSGDHPEVYITKDQITDLAINAVDARKEKLSAGNLFLFGELALAFPENTGSLSIALTVQTASRQISFLIDVGDEYNPDDVQSKIHYYLDQWRIVPR